MQLWIAIGESRRSSLMHLGSQVSVIEWQFKVKVVVWLVVLLLLVLVVVTRRWGLH